MKKTKLLQIFIFILSCNIGIIDGLSQITTNEKPYSIVNNVKIPRVLSNDITSSLVLPTPDINLLEREDSLNNRNVEKLKRVAVAIPINKNINDVGTWITLDNGDLLWQLEISSDKATSLDFTFDKFWLPEGGKFYLYNPTTLNTIGAITSEYLRGNKNDPANFSTAYILGDKIILEYYQPSSIQERPIISIDKAYYGYKKIEIAGNPDYKNKDMLINEDPQFGTSGSCNNTLTYRKYGDWKFPGQSTARILIKLPTASYWCSGSLVNTTARDNRPYFLTAHHCLCGYFDAISNKDASQWVFYWNFSVDSEDYDRVHTSYEPSRNTTIGAIVLANDSPSDFALLKLNQDIRLVSSSPNYLGWDVTGNSGSGGACIHYPSGDIRKISFYNVTPSSSSYNSGTNKNHWAVTWASGTTEGGSSGSPLINQQKRIIGQLHGGKASCSNINGADLFGKISESWTNNNATDPRRRLKDWLDPYNTNEKTTETIEAIKIIGPYELALGQTAKYTEVVNSPTLSNNLQLINYNYRGRYAEIKAIGTGKGYIKMPYTSSSGRVNDQILNINVINTTNNLTMNKIKSNYKISYSQNNISITPINQNLLNEKTTLIYDLIESVSGSIQKTGYINYLGENIDTSNINKGVYILVLKEDDILTSYKILVK